VPWSCKSSTSTHPLGHMGSLFHNVHTAVWWPYVQSVTLACNIGMTE